MPEMNPQTILAMGRAFRESRILLTAAQLDVFTLLSDGPMLLDEAAEKLGADRRGLAILLDAVTAMGLLEKQDGGYRTAAEAEPFLTSGSKSSVLPMLLHSAHMWDNWSSLTSKVCPAGTPARRADAGQWAFIQAMNVVGSQVAPRIVEAVNAGGARRLLDVGGASGTYTIAFLRAHPELQATLFDLPDVVEMARERLGDEGLLGRVTLVPGDFYADALPAGHDLAWLSAIIHQNSREQNVALYENIHAALDAGGRLVVRDHVMSNDHVEPRDGALFAVNMLSATSGGGTYSLSEITEDLTSAGFERIRLLQPDTRMDGLVEAFKP